MSYYGVIEVATGDLLRCGYSELYFDPVLEDRRSDCPNPAKRRYQKGETQMHRWSGSSWSLVDQPAALPIVPNKVEILEESINSATGGSYGTETYVFTAVKNTTTKKTFTPKVCIALLSASLPTKGLGDGDQVSLDIAPETVAGSLVEDIASGVTVIPVGQSVIDLFESETLFKGMDFHLDDGTNKDSCGIVTSWDTENLTITVETATQNSFNAATPTYLKFTASMTPNILGTGFVEITEGNDIMYEYGKDKIGGSHICNDKAVEINYLNTDPNNDKIVRITFGYLY